MGNWTRFSAAGKRAEVVVQRGLLLLLVLIVVELVLVEDHLLDVALGSRVMVFGRISHWVVDDE